MAQGDRTLEEDVLKKLMLGKHPSHCTNMLGEKREEAVTTLLEQVFNSVLQAQATEQLNAEPYERSDEQTTYRNGSRTRMLATRMGPLILHVPTFRDGTLRADLFSSYQRSEQALLLILAEMVIQGVPTRKNQLIERYQGQAPKAMALLDARFDKITAALGLPEPYRKRPRTSNRIERLNEELQRQERVIQGRPSY